MGAMKVCNCGTRFKGVEGFMLGFPGGLAGKESACNVGDLGSIPGLGRSPGGGHGNPLQYSRLENPMVRGAWWATVHGVSKSWTRLSNQAQHSTVTEHPDDGSGIGGLVKKVGK